MRPLLLALLALWAQASAPVDPHGKPDACAQCHASVKADTAPDLIPFAAETGDATCHLCHESDPHQVGILPEQVTVPPDFPLAKGRIACFSCHDEPACDGADLDDENPLFFRDGPYETADGLCAQCHHWRDLTGELNPHAELRKGNTDEELCRNCHTAGRKDEDIPDDRKRHKGNICLSCHRPLPHAGSSRHMGQVPAYMRPTVERSGLPLRSGDQIVCRTCHSPHPEGDPDRHVVEDAPVVPQWWIDGVLVPGLQAHEEELKAELEPVLDEPYFIRLPLTGGELCLSCHDPDVVEAERRRKRRH